MDSEMVYRVVTNWGNGRNGMVSAESIEPKIRFSVPPEFKGEKGYWTPEHFLSAAVGSCFVATFYAIAEISKMEFEDLELVVEGKVGKVDGKLRYAEIVLRPMLTILREEDRERAMQLLRKAEDGCLIARALACPVLMEAMVGTAEGALVA